jgi:uroporphyrinogen-III decarboxylase
LLRNYRSGVKKEVKFKPHFYHHFDYILDTLTDLTKITIPNANNEARYEGITDEIAYYKERGYFTHANINGFFSGIHYFFYPYDKLFVDMILEKDNLKKLIHRLADFNFTVAEQLLKRGVDCITFCDDLGDGRSLLFNPELYRELFWPYHADLARLCHSYNASVHMHSHGNIMKIFPWLVEAGIDMINPCDPYEGMNLQYLKEQFGSKVTLVGGINKFFFDWGPDRMKEYLERTIRIGRRRGGYIVMDSGGVPENISKETYDYYFKLSKELRYGLGLA